MLINLKHNIGDSNSGKLRARDARQAGFRKALERRCTRTALCVPESGLAFVGTLLSPLTRPLTPLSINASPLSHASILILKFAAPGRAS